MTNLAQSKHYLHDKLGIVVDFISNDKALIEFKLDDSIQKALLKYDKFYHNGKRLPTDEDWNNYIQVGSPVKFSCHTLDGYDEISWFVTIAWRHNFENSCSNMKIGMVYAKGCISSLSKRHGTITTGDNKSIYFLASKVYLFEKRFSSSKHLESELSLDDKVFFDAIPCIPEENDENCEWFATVVYKGKRPDISKQTEMPRNSEKINENNVENTNHKMHVSRITSLYNIINQCVNDAKQGFVYGTGIYIDSLNEEFGIILGQFKKNLFQSILFHRKYAFLFKMCLAQQNLTDLFEEGDRMKFIVVDAPPNFITDWIAVQVAINDAKHKDHQSLQTNDKDFYEKKYSEFLSLYYAT